MGFRMAKVSQFRKAKLNQTLPRLVHFRIPKISAIGKGIADLNQERAAATEGTLNKSSLYFSVRQGWHSDRISLLARV